MYGSSSFQHGVIETKKGNVNVEKAGARSGSCPTSVFEEVLRSSRKGMA